MVTHYTDTQLVGEAVATLFTTLNSGPAQLAVIIYNSGLNTINYQWQENNGAAWVNIGQPGSIYNTTLQSQQVALMTVTSSYPEVRLIGNASGGSYLDFAVTRFVERPNGGYVGR